MFIIKKRTSLMNTLTIYKKFFHIFLLEYIMLQNLISLLCILNVAPVFDVCYLRYSKKKIAIINITISPKLSVVAIKD